MKKKSHVSVLKQRTKERILGKAKGPSTTPCAGSSVSDSDAPPAQVFPKTDTRNAWEAYVLKDDIMVKGEMLPVPKVNWPPSSTPQTFKPCLHAEIIIPAEDSHAINSKAREVLKKVPVKKPS
jgi:hypothetical protein